MLKKFLCLLVTSASLMAQHYGPIEIIKSPGQNNLPNSSRNGLAPYKYLITNSDNKPHHITFERHSPHSYYGNPIERLRKSVTVQGNSQVNFQVNIPTTQNSYTDTFNVIIDGERQEKNIQFDSINGNYHETVVLKERSLNLNGGSGLQLQTLEQSVDLLKENLGPYFLFDAIYLTEKKYHDLPKVTQAGLLDYARCGGRLYIAGNIPVTNLEKKNTHAWGKTYNYGFGELYEVDVNLGSNQSKLVSHLEGLTSGVARPHYIKSGRRRGDYDDSVDYLFSDVDQVPHGLLATFVLIFIVITGPVLLFKLNRKNKIIHYLWAAPALSVIFAIGLLIFGGLIDGFTPLEVKHSSTFLDQTTNRSYTRSLLGIYSPVSYARGLHLDKSVVFEFPNDYHHSRATIDSTNDWWIKENAIKAKVPFILNLTEAKTCRKRLQFYPSGDKLKVTNGLGETVDFLQCSHNDKTYLYKKPIKAGETVELMGLASKKSHRFLTVDSTFSTSCSNKEQVINDLAYSKRLENNSYVAITTGENPFIKPTINKANQVSEAIIYGIFEVKK